MSFQFSPETVLIELQRKLAVPEENIIMLVNRITALSTRLADLNQQISLVPPTSDRKEFRSKFRQRVISLPSATFPLSAEAHELGFELSIANRSLSRNESDANKIREQIRLIQLEIGTRAEIIQTPIETPIQPQIPEQILRPIQIFLQQTTPQPLQTQDNTLRNVLLAGGALLLIL